MSPSSSRRGCSRERAYLISPRATQDLGACLQRGTGRHDVVDQDQDTSLNVALRRPGAAPTLQGECSVNVAAPLGRGQRRLGRRWPNAPKRVLDRETQVTGEGGGLIETPRPSAGRVQRHRNQIVGAGEQLVASRSHQRSQWPRQRLAVLVLEGLDDRPKCAVVDPCRSAPREVRLRVTALAARVLRRRRGQRCATVSTERRCEPREVTPAVVADDSAGRMGEESVAGGTARRPGQGKDPVEDTPVSRGGHHLTGHATPPPSSSSWTGGIRELDSRSTTPEAVEVVEATSFLGEHVHDEVEAVEEDPFPMVVPLDVGRSGALHPELFDDFIDDRPYLTASLSRANHEVVRERA